MARKKNTLGVSIGTLDKFLIKPREYLPRTPVSTDDKIFSSLVKTAVSQVSRNSFSGPSSSSLDGEGRTDTAAYNSMFTSLLKGMASTSNNKASPVLFKQSQSQIAASALQTVSMGKKNL